MNECDHKKPKNYRKILYCKNCGIVFGSNSNTLTSGLKSGGFQVSNPINKKFSLIYPNILLKDK